jgi:flavin-dependent dehydrogenase
MINSRVFDTLVLGAGPAGSTTAALLAEQGLRVLVLEREKFPRYHIGESLLPYGYFILERIGVLDKMKASHFTKKYSVQFVSSRGKLSVPFYFFQQLKHEASMTWQVLRSEFDQLLLDNARDQGNYLLGRLRDLQTKFEEIGDVRGLGLMTATEFVKDRKTKEPAVAFRDRVLEEAYKHGLILLPCGKSAIRYIPPLIVRREEIDEAVEILGAALQTARTAA